MGLRHSPNVHSDAAAKDAAGDNVSRFREVGVFKRVTVPTSGKEPIDKKSENVQLVKCINIFSEKRAILHGKRLYVKDD